MLRYITRSTTRNEYYTNPHLDGLTGVEYRRMYRYLNSIGELTLIRTIVEHLPPKYAFDEHGRLTHVNLTEADITAQLDTITNQP
ncbi:hypothetical protein [Mycobacterium aquaticum]|uniref:Uncharacterized protein n=1 Tax=Mycobacterium aquaticum TaxID=1927124 RepID=A0A1X0AH00_9MYCO|nr:hypothetical protein [Mycobacterium aquaticum]ORA29302.1 hypothetical protein BST13_27355 [Mycobacterium aquaticum]